ncbi:hypothetical protein C7M84_014900 [Penaeus vannamei]|uniref:Uncharacterized protein n=1 Tax=Penaeus vannamei TaxID=6689 RepID=A0A3R7PHV1_PENVA|nr:hypothetical protein C7M84_014900 [Penaeus vannamei]
MQTQQSQVSHSAPRVSPPAAAAPATICEPPPPSVSLGHHPSPQHHLPAWPDAPPPPAPPSSLADGGISRCHARSFPLPLTPPPRVPELSFLISSPASTPSSPPARELAETTPLASARSSQRNPAPPTVYFQARSHAVPRSWGLIICDRVVGFIIIGNDEDIKTLERGTASRLRLGGVVTAHPSRLSTTPHVLEGSHSARRDERPPGVNSLHAFLAPERKNTSRPISSIPPLKQFAAMGAARPCSPSSVLSSCDGEPHQTPSSRDPPTPKAPHVVFYRPSSSETTHACDVRLITTYLSPASAGIMAARPRIDCGRRGPRALRTAPRAPVAKNQLIGAVTWSPPNSRSSNQGAPFPSACGPTEGMTNDPTDLRDMNS